jgi:hypothetical protein
LDLEGGPYKYPKKKCQRTAKFFPTFGLSQDIARAFNLLKFLGGSLHLKPTAGCQIATLIFRFKGDPVNILRKIAEGRQSFFPVGV